MATKGKVSAEDMLKSRNFKLASGCPKCVKQEESVDHLLSILGGSLGFGTCHSPYWAREEVSNFEGQGLGPVKISSFISYF